MSHDNTWRYLGNVCGGAISFTAGAKFLGAHESSCLLASVVGAFVGFFVARLVIAADRSLFWTTAPTDPGYYWLHEPPTKPGETTEPVIVEVVYTAVFSNPNALGVIFGAVDHVVSIEDVTPDSRWHGPFVVPDPFPFHEVSPWS